MSTWITDLVDRTGGRHFSAVERRVLKLEAARLRAAYAASQELERVEAAIVDDVASALRSRGGPPWYDASVAEGALALGLALRAAARAAMADEPRWLDELLLDYARAVLEALGADPQAVAECYGELASACERRLSVSSFAVLGPYVARVRSVLSGDPQHLARKKTAAELRASAGAVVEQVVAEQRAASPEFESLRADHGESLRLEVELLLSALADAVELDDPLLFERRAAAPLAAAWEEDAVDDALEQAPAQLVEAVRENLGSASREVAAPWLAKLPEQLAGRKSGASA